MIFVTKLLFGLFPVNTDDGADVDTKHKSVVSVDVTAKGDVEKKVVNSFKIPPNTVLAYSCNEFSIDSTGVASLHSAVDIKDDLDEPLFLQNAEAGDPGWFPIFLLKTKYQKIEKLR